ncbi:hypothetical protein KR222_009910 [Zaprionus bogoriensis]|nr:hypothetical protein KR222_009910 [Zaprionus bogoriensis]
MCETGILIDLAGWDEPAQEDEPVLVESNSFKGPYDPFEYMEKEACLKKARTQTQIQTRTRTDDQDLNNEPPPDALQLDDSDQQSREDQITIAKRDATISAVSTINVTSPPPSCLKIFRDVMKDSLQMIAAESPIKLVEDEPIPVVIGSAAPTSDPTDYECSNMEFEARLKKLRIAMSENSAKPSAPEVITEQIHTEETNASVDVDHSPQGEVERLWAVLKSLVCQHVEVSMRTEFDSVIERLRLRTVVCPLGAAAAAPSRLAVDSPHATYTRQATFDLQLQKQQQKESDECVTGSSRKVDEFPDAMTCSSATYDGESVATVPIPIIDSVPPSAAPQISIPRPDAYVSSSSKEVNDNLMFQINELLERHNLQSHDEQQHLQHQQLHEHNETKAASGSTVILIVNSTASGQAPSCKVHPTASPSSKTPPISAIGSSRASTYRRRSSSLSIHDKAKPERPKPLANQNVPPKELLNPMTSLRQRRNSYSVNPAAAKAAPLGAGRSAVIKESTTPTKTITSKRLVSRVKPLNLSTVSTANHLNPTTPMPSRTKPSGQMFCTSTPMPQMRAQQRRSLRPMGTYSNSTASNSNVQAMCYSKRSAQ